MTLNLNFEDKGSKEAGNPNEVSQARKESIRREERVEFSEFNNKTCNVVANLVARLNLSRGTKKEIPSKQSP